MLHTCLLLSPLAYASRQVAGRQAKLQPTGARTVPRHASASHTAGEVCYAPLRIVQAEAMVATVVQWRVSRQRDMNVAIRVIKSLPVCFQGRK